MKTVIKFFIAFVCIVQANAQIISKSDDFVPPWRSGDMPKIKSNFFYFQEMQGEGKTLAQARENAILGLISEIARTKGISVSMDEISSIKSNSLNGKYREEENTNRTYNIKVENFDLSFEKVDEYWEQNQTGFYCWVLFEVANDAKAGSFKKVEFSTDYGMSSVWRSAIVPGWGQLYKKQKYKGLSILGSEAVLLGVGLVAENMRISNINSSKNTRDVKYIKQYLNDADSNETLRNISFATAGAVYIYNLIDAAVSKGAKHYVTNNHLNLIPSIDSHSVGMSLVYNFK